MKAIESCFCNKEPYVVESFVLDDRLFFQKLNNCNEADIPVNVCPHDLVDQFPAQRYSVPKSMAFKRPQILSLPFSSSQYKVLCFNFNLFIIVYKRIIFFFYVIGFIENEKKDSNSNRRFSSSSSPFEYG